MSQRSTGVKRKVLLGLQSKAKKKAVVENLRHGHLVHGESSDEDSDSNDVYMYPTDVHKDEQRRYREVVCASKWEHEQRRHYKGKGMAAESSSFFQRFKRFGEPSRNEFESTFQKSSLKDMASKDRLEENMCRLISKFFIYENVDIEKASWRHFKDLISMCQQAGNKFCYAN